MNADLTKVPYTAEELEAIKDAVSIYSGVEAQLGPEDEDPGKIDFDDIVTVATTNFAEARNLIAYVMAGRTTRERIARTKYILDGAERAFGIIENRSPKPGLGATSNP